MREFFELNSDYDNLEAARLIATYSPTEAVRVDRKEDDGNLSFFVSLGDNLDYNPELREETGEKIAMALRAYLRKFAIIKRDLVLIVGVGNEGMTADALGAKTLKYLDITEHLYSAKLKPRGKGRLAGVASGASGVTGLESYDIVKGIVGRVKPKLVIAVDTLAARQAVRLKRVIQLTDKGLVPGSGVSNSRPPINKDSMGVPVVAIGVPLVIYARNILLEYSEYKLSDLAGGKDNRYNRSLKELEDMVVTPKEIDLAVEEFAEVIAAGINGAIHR